MNQLVACEESRPEFICLEQSELGMCLCCCEFGHAGKFSCCPEPMTCFGTLGQCCCCHYRCAFPCSKTVPCEVPTVRRIPAILTSSVALGLPTLSLSL